MRYIENHAHMVSRTTDDYARMALTGCVAVSEPAFWAGYDRRSAAAVDDYFYHLTEYEPKRAAQAGIRHYAWIGLNPKESEHRALAAEVLQLVPTYLQHPTVLGVGEIGLNRVTRNELATFNEQLALAEQLEQLVLIHTPHMEDKWKGTRLILDALKDFPRVTPERVLIDHVEEHTIGLVRDAGYWAGITLYPLTKVTPARAVDLIEQYGPDQLVISSSSDWGVSEPLGIPYLAQEMGRRRHDETLIDRIVFQNPSTFLGQCPKFSVGRDADTRSCA
ncbi:MAG: TatD family hydrolase [Armatimonadota bacterium]